MRPQALIGEKYIDCLPTQPRVEGTPLPPPLRRIPKGQEGAGQRLLPVKNTSSPVDVDLLGDISRLPERQRFTIIINELGAGLAGRGSDLNEVIRRANPALREFDRVLAILASENQVLTKLAVDSDKALAPFARVRERVADFIVQSNKVAQASAAHRGALARNLQDFPPFLRQLGPAMERLERFAEQTTPTFTDLNVAAPAINQAFTHLPAFSNSSKKFFDSLGKTAKQSGPALVASNKLLGELKSLGTAAKPFTGNLSTLFTSLRETGGLERIMDFIFLGAGAANGYDQLGHFLRTEGVGDPLREIRHRRSLLALQQEARDERHERDGGEGEHPAGHGPRDGPHARCHEGATPAQAIAKYPGTAHRGRSPGLGGSSTSAQPSGGPPTSQPVGGSTSGTTYYSPSGEGTEADGMLLNYLLGN